MTHYNVIITHRQFVANPTAYRTHFNHHMQSCNQISDMTMRLLISTLGALRANPQVCVAIESRDIFIANSGIEACSSKCLLFPIATIYHRTILIRPQFTFCDVKTLLLLYLTNIR